ncbi:zinc carboxypeptidase-related protein [Ochromonadaceae sp. CCMP2298]|nr:zinc carboxypeptidase-related protein [Ochromonadaceae sp. CCMP2298]
MATAVLKKWGEPEKLAWLASQTIKRSYQDEVVAKIEALKANFDVLQYGALSYNAERYPVFAVKSRGWDAAKRTVLVTGGVHGYETSGVQGALRFLETSALSYVDKFNVVVTPCISPWGYETVNRWNNHAVDPNRNFCEGGASEEATLLRSFIASLSTRFTVHIDLHETTDTDNSVFGPEKASRDGEVFELEYIPDGFYNCADTLNPAPDFQKAVIDAVERVTHIAEADADLNIIGTPISQRGVINYPTAQLGLCIGFTSADFSTTTEVYPDSPDNKSPPENCILAQVAAVTGALDYAFAKGGSCDAL